MSLYHIVELAVVGGAVAAAAAVAYRRFMPRFGRAKASSGAGCSECSSCGSCGTGSAGPASVDEPGQRERPLVFRPPR